MHLKSNNIEFKSKDDAHEVNNELFESLLSSYQAGLETSMRGSDFIFDLVQLCIINAKIALSHAKS